MYQFDNDISLIQQEPGFFKGNISDNWSIIGNPNGGYLMALLANAIIKDSHKRSFIILTVNFLSLCVPGKVDLFTEHLASSRQFDRWQARLSQKGEKKVIAMGTIKDYGDDQGEKIYEKSAPNILPPGECVAIPKNQNYTFFDRIDVRLDPNCAGYLKGDLAKRSVLEGWVRFRDNRPFDELSTLLIIDSFPPPIFASQGPVVWVPTLELSLNMRNTPKTHWLKCVFRSNFLNNGIVEGDGEIWDEDGELIAISRHISQFRR